MSYPIDIEAAKNSKLFKKFMDSKNKSNVMAGPKIQNVGFEAAQPIIQKQPLLDIKMNVPPKSITYNNVQEEDHIIQAFNPQPIPIPIRQRQTIRKKYESNEKSKESSLQKYEQRKTQIIQKGGKDNKYEKLLQQFSQLQQKMNTQRKQSKKQIIKLQQQLEAANKKIFELRNKQDELILQAKRLKQRAAAETKQRLQQEENNRELQYQIQQLKDMLDGQQTSTKKKEDETLRWKKINDDLRQKNKQLQIEVHKQSDSIDMMGREKFVMQKQISNKQSHLNEMREKINSLITENGIIKDQIYHITSKLYQFEQENRSLKADLRRHGEEFPISYLHEQLQHASRQTKSQSQYIPPEVEGAILKQQNGPEKQRKTERRRGEFARQRGIKKPQTIIKNQAEERQQQTHQNKNGQNNKEVGQAIRKLEELNAELQKLMDMKAMTGGMRRQKINIERQIQQLQQFLKGKQ